MLKIPHKAMIVVADGTGAKFFRNSGRDGTVSLAAAGEFKPSDLESEGPAGKRPPESTLQETEEATFAKLLANDLYRRAQKGDFEALVLIADPQTLGQIRPSLHKVVQDLMLTEIPKTLTNSPTADIENTLRKEAE